MAKRSLQTSFFLLILGQALGLQAQVLNSPIPQSGGGVQPAGAVTSVPAAVEAEQSGWGIPMPQITMPKMTMPKITMPDMASITQPVKSGFGKVKSGTKKAWEGTKEMFTFGKDNQGAPAANAGGSKPSFWQRIVSRETEPQVPQTVGEFMSQPRLDP